MKKIKISHKNKSTSSPVTIVELLKNYNYFDFFLLIQFLFIYIFLLLFYEKGDFFKTISVFGTFISIISLQLLRKRSLFLPSKLILPGAIFLFGLFISTVFSQTIELSIYSLIYYVASLTSLIIGYSIINLKRENLFVYLISILLVSVIVAAGYFIKEYFLGSTKINNSFVGPFYWHNQMAGFLLFFTPGIFFALKFIKSNVFRVLSLIIGILLSLMLLQTHSRGGWLVFIAATMLITIPLINSIKVNIKRHLSITVLLLAGIIITFSAVPVLKDNVESIYTDLLEKEKTTSGSLRMSTYSSAVDMFLDYPIAGIGIGTFGEAMYKYQKSPWLYAKHTHNHYLQLISEGGLVTFLGFCLILFLVMGQIVKKRKEIEIGIRKGSRRYVLMYIIVIALVTSILHNIVDVDWNYPALGFMFWFSLGILLNLTNEKGNLDFSNYKLPTLVAILAILFSSLIMIIHNRYIEAGQISFQNEEYELSQNYYAKASGLLPISYRSFAGRGYANNKLEDLDLASFSFSRATELNPFNADHHFQKFLIDLKANKLTQEEKISRIVAIIDLNPYAQPFYYTEAYRQYRDLGDTKKANEFIVLGAEERFPINQNYNNLKYIYNSKPVFQGNLFDLHMTYALTLKAMGDEKNSKEAMEKTLKIYDGNHEFNVLFNSLNTIK